MSMIRATACAALVAVALVAGTDSPGAEPQAFNLGPTGLTGTLSGNAIKVTKVDKGSPADGRIKAGDEVIGAGAAKFREDVRRELAAAIDEAETEEGGGKLTLILKDDKPIDLRLEVLGRYSATAPYDCRKSEKIIARAAEHVLKSKDLAGGACHSGLLGLMATGEKKYIDAAGAAIRNADWAKPDAARIEAVLQGDADMGYVGWYWGYNLITLSEYYLLTRDASVLPAIKTYAVSLARGQDAGGLWGHRMATPRRNGRLPGYAQMNQSCLSDFMGMLMAKKCGLDEPVFAQGLKKTYAYFVSFVGRGAFPYGVHGPNTGTYNNNGTSGSAALCMALAGNNEGARFFSQLAATTYDGQETGHASTFFNPLWTPLGAHLSGPDVTQRFFANARWLWTMYRCWDGSFSRFGGGEQEGSQAGVALLSYCLPRKALLITGKGADESIWVTGDAAKAVVERSKVDYAARSADELMAMFGDPIPQVTRAAVWALRKKEGDFTPRLTAMMKAGSKTEKMSAFEFYGWQCPSNQQMAVMGVMGAVLRDSNEDPWVRASAASALSWIGAPAYEYYGDMVALTAENRPDDVFGDIDWSLGGSINRLCPAPFPAGVIRDKTVFYKAARKLAENKRQQVRAEGMRMLEGMPLEDFCIVADTVVHVIEDKDPTYHSYHSPGGPVGSGVSVLANLGIREGMDYALAIRNIESGKGSFKLRAIMDSLAKYGANAKPIVEQLKQDPDWKSVPENGKLKKNWNALITAIEQDKTPRKLISLDEARNAGKLQEHTR